MKSYARAPLHGVQTLDGFRLDELRAAAHAAGHSLVQVELGACQDKRAVLAAIAQALNLSPAFGGNLDALYDSLTDLPEAMSAGLALVLEHIPHGPGFDADARSDLLEVLRDAAAFHAGSGPAFRVFYCLA